MSSSDFRSTDRRSLYQTRLECVLFHCHPSMTSTLSEGQVEWNSDKEHFLWEVIAKSRVVEGGGTDCEYTAWWRSHSTDGYPGKGLAEHLQVPLPYLLYRAQVRYEEDLRGLRTALSPASPTPQPTPVPSGATFPTQPSNAKGEYFPGSSPPERLIFPRRDSLRAGNGQLPPSISGRSLTIRTRLNSLGSAHRINSPQKVTSSSVLTLQGPKRTFIPRRTLSPTPSRPSPSSPSSGADGGSEGEEEEEELRKFEEEERRIEEQQALELKLKNLELKFTKDKLGLVTSPRRPQPPRHADTDRGRHRPLSGDVHRFGSSSRRYSASHTPSNHSLSSASSPQGSIPDMPSPPPEGRSPPMSPMARQLAGPSRSPPTVSHGNAWAQSARSRIRQGRSERGSEIGSTTSSFSDLSGKSP